MQPYRFLNQSFILLHCVWHNENRASICVHAPWKSFSHTAILLSAFYPEFKGLNHSHVWDGLPLPVLCPSAYSMSEWNVCECVMKKSAWLYFLAIRTHYSYLMDCLKLQLNACVLNQFGIFLWLSCLLHSDVLCFLVDAFQGQTCCQQIYFFCRFLFICMPYFKTFTLAKSTWPWPLHSNKPMHKFKKHFCAILQIFCVER